MTPFPVYKHTYPTPLFCCCCCCCFQILWFCPLCIKENLQHICSYLWLFHWARSLRSKVNSRYETHHWNEHLHALRPFCYSKTVHYPKSRLVGRAWISSVCFWLSHRPSSLVSWSPHLWGQVQCWSDYSWWWPTSEHGRHVVTSGRGGPRIGDIGKMSHNRWKKQDRHNKAHSCIHRPYIHRHAQFGSDHTQRNKQSTTTKARAGQTVSPRAQRHQDLVSRQTLQTTMTCVKS